MDAGQRVEGPGIAMNRRALLKKAAVAGLGGVLAPRIARADAAIGIDVSKPGPEISPHIYGHFIEHLGAVIYDGIWVGRNSKIPNVDGIRKQFVDDMKRIGAPNLRWPGGCFADGYHWRDGIGPEARRPRTYNFWQSRMPAGLDHTETNQFGIHEFIRLCRLVNAVPYVAANVGSGNPQEFHDWVSYCNAPAGTLSLAAERAANGEKEPFGVRYWGVGNESWGCGGNMKPSEYATLYRQFITQFPAYPPEPFLTATGPRGHSRDLDIGWTTGFFEAMQGHRAEVHGFSLHFYTDFRNTKEKVASFNREGWYAVLREAARTETVITRHWEAMGKLDTNHRTKLVIDEWGVWYPSGEETVPAHLLSQPLTLRDALHTAITFDVFNRHAEKIAMANVAQTVNCLHSLFLAHEDKYARTPAFHVFEMYRPHMGARLVPMNAEIEQLSGAGLPALIGSASIRDKRLTVTLTNPSLDAALTARIRVAGAMPAEAKGVVLTHSEMTARNTFQKPDEVTTKPLAVQTSAQEIAVTLPKQSVAALDVRLS